MPIITNFTSVVDLDNTLLTLTDSSTAAYSGETITSRSYQITKADGSVTTLDSPVVNGVGDSVTFPLNGDIAITVKLILIPSIVVPDSIYFYSKNLLLPGKLVEKLAQIRKDLILDIPIKELICNDNENLQHVELIAACLDAATDMIAVNISSSQEALNMGHELSTKYDLN